MSDNISFCTHIVIYLVQLPGITLNGETHGQCICTVRESFFLFGDSFGIPCNTGFSQEKVFTKIAHGKRRKEK